MRKEWSGFKAWMFFIGILLGIILLLVFLLGFILLLVPVILVVGLVIWVFWRRGGKEERKKKDYVEAKFRVK